MARDENLPFPLGSTYFNGDTTTIDVTVGTNLEGREFIVEDEDLSNGSVGSTSARTNRPRRVRIVRNMNATKLNAKEVAKLKTDGAGVGDFGGRVDGKTASYADKGYPVDEYLSAGCLQYDLCYVVTDGPATVVTDTSGDTNFGIGALVVAGATTAGRVIEADKTLTGANLVNMMQFALGLALAAINATSTNVVIDVGAQRR